MSNFRQRKLPDATNLSCNRDYDEILQMTIKETLKDVFGSRSASTIFKTMERVHSLRLNEVPEKSRQFNIALKDILGTGHQIIEDLILENFSTKLGQRFEYVENYTFSDYINKIKGSDSGKIP